MKKYFLIIFLALLLAGCINQTETIVINRANNFEAPMQNQQDELGDREQVSNQIDSPTSSESESPVVIDHSISSEREENQEIVVEVPSQFELDVAFAQQAPFSNWEPPFKEACEEASMIMVDKYFKGEPLNENIMEEEILLLISWQEKQGYQLDATAREVVDILNSYFGLTARVENQVTVDRIKYELNQGNLIIVPAAGRELDNPNFQVPGPIYHMLVIKGYDNSKFITNDPGTRKGNGFRYQYDNLLKAIHDWDHDLAKDGMTEAEINSTPKVMVVVGR